MRLLIICSLHRNGKVIGKGCALSPVVGKLTVRDSDFPLFGFVEKKANQPCEMYWGI